MSGARIFVLRLKDVIRTGIFVLIGLLLIVFLVWVMLPKKTTERASVYMPGTYAAQIVLHSKPVSIEVTVSDEEITEVALIGMEAEQEMFYPLFKPTMSYLSEEVVRAQSTDITMDAESAMTGEILLKAIRAALAQAIR